MPLQWSSTLADSPRSSSSSSVMHAIGGAALVLIIGICRTRLPWFQLHSIGFLAAGSWAMYLLWFSLLIGWVCKVCVMRFGVQAYRRA